MDQKNQNDPIKVILLPLPISSKIKCFPTMVYMETFHNNVPTSFDIINSLDNKICIPHNITLGKSENINIFNNNYCNINEITLTSHQRIQPIPIQLS